MKKIFLLIAMVVLSSCGSLRYYETHVIGDVILMNDDGVVMRSYPNSILEHHDISGNDYSIKNGGMLNFKDANGIYHLIGGGIICVDSIRSITEEKTIVSEQDWLINSIQSLDKSIRTMEKKIKEDKKNGGDTAELERILREKEEERDNLAKTLWEKYNTLPYII